MLTLSDDVVVLEAVALAVAVPPAPPFAVP
jgi:hypothetical protein